MLLRSLKAVGSQRDGRVGRRGGWRQRMERPDSPDARREQFTSSLSCRRPWMLSDLVSQTKTPNPYVRYETNPTIQYLINKYISKAPTPFKNTQSKTIVKSFQGSHRKQLKTEATDFAWLLGYLVKFHEAGLHKDGNAWYSETFTPILLLMLYSTGEMGSLLV